ncbi:MAG: hypothetical protein ACOX6P_11560 [Candidatus Merdivicinus sp.]|jgi:hypothetical protein
MRTTLVFFDDYWLDFKSGIKRSWIKPIEISSYEDPNFPLVTYPSLEWCPEVQRYRVWYDAVYDLNKNNSRYLCMAESVDGINWKSSCYHNQDSVNQIYPHCVYSGKGGVSGGSVFRDEYETDPMKRYKYVGSIGIDYQKNKQPRQFPLSMLHSSDGVNWHESNKIVYPYTSDTYNRFFYNPVMNKYQVLMRGGYIDRRICTITSEKENYSFPQLLLHPDPGEEENGYAIQYYGMGTRWNAGMFLGLLMRFHTCMTDSDLKKMNGYMDTELVYSYDGICWMHTNRQPLVERSLSPNFGFNQLYLLDMTSCVEDESVLLVGVAARNPHLRGEEYLKWQQNDQQKLTRLNFYKIRKDGFCALDCCGKGGRMITKTFLLESADMTLNVAALSGNFTLSILNAEGDVYPGFSAQDFSIQQFDAVSAVPHWKNHSLHELVGKRIRFCMDFSSASFYSLTADIRPCIAYPQQSISRPQHN